MTLPDGTSNLIIPPEIPVDAIIFHHGGITVADNTNNFEGYVDPDITKMLEGYDPAQPAEYADPNSMPLEIDFLDEWALEHIFWRMKILHRDGAMHLYYRRNHKTFEYEFKNAHKVINQGAIFSLVRESLPESEYTQLLTDYATHMQEYLAKHAGKKKVRVPTFIQYCVHQFKLYLEDPRSAFDGPPVAISEDPTVPCTIYLDPQKIQPGPCPSWLYFESQFPEMLQPVWRAWLAAVFTPDNTSRQIMYLYDPKGHSGKSVVCSALFKIWPGLITSINSRQIQKDDYIGALLYGKLLTLLDDTRNERAADTELLHQITGGSAIVVNQKYSPAFSALMHCKFLVTSNIMCKFETFRNNVMSRLIIIPMTRREDGPHLRDGLEIGSNTFESNLIEEFWHYFYLCKEAYDEFCPTGANILIKDQKKYLSYILSGISDQQLQICQFVEDNYEFTPGHTVLRHDMERDIKNYFKIEKIEGGKNFFSQSLYVYLNINGSNLIPYGHGRYGSQFTNLKRKEKSASSTYFRIGK